MTTPIFSNGVGCDIVTLRPLTLGEAFVVPFNPDIGPSIQGLLFHGGPTAISGRVRPVIVYAVKRCASRALTHVGKESGKVSNPFWRDGDAATSIFRKFLTPLIQASVFHLNPRVVFRRLSFSMRCLLASNEFTPKATARRGEPIFQCVTSDIGQLAAFATARPPRDRFGPFGFFGACKDDQAAECSAQQIQHSHQ